MEQGMTMSTAATTPGFSIFTLPRPKKQSHQSIRPQKLQPRTAKMKK